MFKKSLLVASLLGIGAIASGVALADTGMSSTYCKPGFYAGVQAGRGDTFYNEGDVFGQAISNNNITNASNAAGGALTFSSDDVDDSGMAGRVYAGYQFNPYFAAEMGYTQFNKTDSDALGGYTDARGTHFNTTAYHAEVTEHAMDVVGKLTMPFQYGFGAFLKAGAAFVAADKDINYSSSSSVGTLYTKSYQAVRGTWGAGLDYTIPNTSFDVDVSYTEILGGGGIPKATLAALGLNYKFA